MPEIIGIVANLALGSGGMFWVGASRSRDLPNGRAEGFGVLCAAPAKGPLTVGELDQ